MVQWVKQLPFASYHDIVEVCDCRLEIDSKRNISTSHKYSALLVLARPFRAVILFPSRPSRTDWQVLQRSDLIGIRRIFVPGGS